MAKEKSYAELLRDPRWQRRRLEILAIDPADGTVEAFELAWSVQMGGVERQ